jgi:hypothetical protein
MSSLESHTIVPTLTMFGRVSEWIWLFSILAVVTGALCPHAFAAHALGAYVVS